MALAGRHLTRLVPLFFPVALAAASPTADSPYHLGFGFLTETPRQDFRDLTRRTGTGAVVFLDQELGEGWSLRTRAEYTVFREGPAPANSPLPSLLPPGGLRMASNQTSLGGELRYEVDGLGGLFVLGGLHGTRFEFKTVAPGPPADPSQLAGPNTTVLTKEKTSFKLGWAVGAGWQFGEHVAAVVRFSTLNLDGTTLGMLGAGLEVRF